MSSEPGCSSQSTELRSANEEGQETCQNQDQESQPAKKIKFLKHEDVYIENLPSCEAYERSYMHRDLISHVLVTKTQFVITASVDGVVKFWKKTSSGIEFVKNFKSHTGPIKDIAATPNGSEVASISRKDRSVKIFDVVNFDMINMLSLNFEPRCIEWISSDLTDSENLVISDSQSGKIFTFDARQLKSEPKRTLDSIHTSIVCRIRHNPVQKIVISIDVDGNVKYWRSTGQAIKCISPPGLDIFSRKVGDVKSDDPPSQAKSKVHNISFSPDGEYFATTSSDRHIRIFRLKSGKLMRIYDESLKTLQDLQSNGPIMNTIDFARKMAIERELDRCDITNQENAIFDQSGKFIIFPTMLGVKIVNWVTDRLVRSLGREETNFRPLCLGLFQGLIFEKVIRRFNMETIESGVNDPTLYCTSYRKNRFYCFSNRYFEEETNAGDGVELIKDRDIFNEKPTREEVIAAIEIEKAAKQSKVHENATIHTTMGDIHLKLFPDRAPKACENFCVHSDNNYYNNHIFHRVIKQFMIQTGDPTGTGTGGESIWDEEFEDEFCDDLRHDKPYILSMANCGPNTNGSQFFITVAPCPFLDNKHTVFGKVVRGMDVCQAISKVKTDPRTDKPYTDVKIINIRVF